MSSQYKYVIGIDPGKRGALACLCVCTGAVSFSFMPVKKAVYPTQYTKTGKVKKVKRKKSEPVEVFDLEKILSVLGGFVPAAERKHCLVAIEEQHGRMRDTKHTVLQVGKSQAYLEMACVALGYPFQVVAPSLWKPAYVPPKAEKAESLKAALELYPKIQLPLVKDESKAEALLIADFVLSQPDCEKPQWMKKRPLRKF